MINFIHVTYILFYLNVASVVSSMEFLGFSEIKLLVAMVTMTSFIFCIVSFYYTTYYALECADSKSAFTFLM